MSLVLDPIIGGNPNGPTIVFIQGWPDNAALWDDTVDVVGATYRCVRVTLPNFDGHRSVRRGYRTDEIVDALEVVVRDAAKDGPVTLVLHDWGCYWGHPVHHRCPELVSRVVGIDVAPHFVPTVGGALGIVAYQSWLFGAFVLGGPVGDWMTRGLAKVIHVPNAETRPLDAWMNYPYRNVWSDMLVDRQAKLTRGYWPTCPILFLYGAKKLFAFHGKKWVDHVEETGGEVIGLPTDHWVMKDASFIDVLARWLAKTHDAAIGRGSSLPVA